MSKFQPRPWTTTKRQAIHKEGVKAVHQPAWKRQLASAARWLHIYLSMISFAILLFFAVTGLTLNHTEWFGEHVTTVEHKGKLDVKWVSSPDTNKIGKLEIVEFLRNAHGIKGSLGDFRIDDQEISLSFRGPGYTADSFIDRESGEYELTESRMGFVAVINDLHKGRDTGGAWSLVIDISAILMTVVSLTGLVLMVFLKKKRLAGLLIAAIGTLISYLIYVLLVP